jgi:hypothetical protein
MSEALQTSTEAHRLLDQTSGYFLYRAHADSASVPLDPISVRSFKENLSVNLPNLFGQLVYVFDVYKARLPEITTMQKHYYWNGIARMLAVHSMGRQVLVEPIDTLPEVMATTDSFMTTEPWIWDELDTHNTMLNEVIGSVARRVITPDQDGSEQLHEAFRVGARAAHVIDGLNRIRQSELEAAVLTN